MIIKGNFIYMTSRTDMQIRQQQFLHVEDGIVQSAYRRIGITCIYRKSQYGPECAGLSDGRYGKGVGGNRSFDFTSKRGVTACALYCDSEICSVHDRKDDGWDWKIV